MKTFTIQLIVLHICGTFTCMAQINPVTAGNIQNILDSGRISYGIEGLEATIILPGNCTFTTTSGYATATNDPVDTVRFWHWASTTKALTAAIVLQLYDSGYIDINDSIGSYINPSIIPGLDGRLEIKRFLNHTTNLTSSWASGTTFNSAVFSSPCTVWNFDSTLNPAYWLPPNPVPFNPLQPHKYLPWNNYTVLTKLIEAVTGNSLSTEFQNRLFTPLGMTNSSLGVNGINMATINGSYDGNSNKSFNCWNAYLSTRGGSSYLISSTSDVARFMRAFHKSQFISQSIINQAHVITPGTPLVATTPCLGSAKLYYGYGTEIFEVYPSGSNDTLLFFGHAGNGIGSSATFHHLPTDVTVSIASNDYSLSASFGTTFILSNIFCYLRNNPGASNCVSGIPESESISLELYPNPAQTELSLKALPQNGVKLIRIIRLDGRVIRTESTQETSIDFDIRDLSSGSYLISISSERDHIIRKWVKN